MLCVCNFSKPIKGYILRMIRKARLVRATVDVHISSVNPKMIFCCFEALTGRPLQYLLNCKVFVLIFSRGTSYVVQTGVKQSKMADGRYLGKI